MDQINRTESGKDGERLLLMSRLRMQLEWKKARPLPYLSYLGSFMRAYRFLSSRWGILRNCKAAAGWEGGEVDWLDGVTRAAA